MKLAIKTTALWIVLCLITSVPAQSQQSNLDSIVDRLKKREKSVASKLRNKFSQNIPVLSPSVTPDKRTCATVESEEKLREKYPERPSVAEFEALFQQRIEAYQRTNLNRDITEVITIPLIVHVVHNGENLGQGANISTTQIQSQIDVLNEDFRRTGQGSNSHPDGADVEIQFAPAIFDPQGNRLSEPGIHRIDGERSGWDYNAAENTLKPQTQWDPERYFNMWTVNFGGDEEDLLGYAQFPSLSGLDGLRQNEGLARTDGVVIRYQSFGRVGNVEAPYDGGRTTTHEVGHWLGLRHIWGDGDCDEDDFCNDTPPASQPNYDCVEISSCPENGRDMVENYMDYSPDDCMNVFTNDQKARMRTVLDNSPRRRELLNSTVHIDDGTPVDAPVAAFVLDKSSACTDEIITFQDQSSNNPTNWEWKFYDSAGNLLATFDSQDLQVTFNGPGSYYVELSVSNSSGNTSVSEQSVITILSNELGNEILIDFEDTTSLIPNWVLFNPDADRTFALSGVSAFGAGNYSAVFDNYSLGSDPSGTVDALISPRLDFSNLTNPYLQFDHAYAQYDDEYSDTLVIIYSLDCGSTFQALGYTGGADLATAPPTGDYFEPEADQWKNNQISLASLQGEPSVHILITNLSGWGNNLYLDNIIFLDGDNVVPETPTADFTIAKTRICEGDMIQFQDQSTNFPSQWLWAFEGGNPAVSEDQNPLIQYDTPGTYGVQLTASNTFGAGVVERNDYIEVVPLPEVSIHALQDTICEGSTIQLTASGAEEYLWFDERSGSQPIFQGDTLELTLFESRTYTLVGSNELGCENETSLSIIVVPNPMVAINTSQDTICEGSTIELTANGANEYLWFDEANASQPIFEGEALTLSLFESRQFTVLGMTEFGCANESQVTISVIPTPEIPDVLIEGDTLTAIVPVGANYAYQWYLNDTLISDAQDSSFIISQTGNYSLEVINSGECSALSSVYNVILTTLDDPDINEQVGIYPNPTQDKVNIQLPTHYKGAWKLRIKNALGQELSSLNQELKQAETTIDLTHLPDGIYFLHLTHKEVLAVKRIVKQ